MPYTDTTAIVQVIGGIFIKNDLLDDTNYIFHEEDFPEDFHKILFGSIYNLHLAGVNKITIQTIEDYLREKPKSYGVYQSGRGSDYLKEITEHTEIDSFDYYYKRMKKMTLMRMYNTVAGIDLRYLYDPDNIFDSAKKQRQEDWLDSTPIEEIADIIDNKIMDIRLRYAENADQSAVNAGDCIDALLERLQTTPEIGVPLFGGGVINAVTRGARLKKFFLRSASTGLGKTRSMIADACYIACDKIYDSEKKAWVDNGTKEPTLYISTEQEKDEIQTMMLAFLSDVNETHILDNEYGEGEYERVLEAAMILKNSPLYIQQLPDFSMQDIEKTLKRNIRDYGVKYLCFDYLHSSMKILSEVSSKAGVKGLREDNVLFMISIRFKDLCNQYGIFILSATQLNGNYQEAKVYNQNLLRGAKAIADKVDIGLLMLEVSPEDLEALKPVLENGQYDTPFIKMSVYKNRRGEYNNLLLWCKANRGTCKIIPMFATDYQYKLIPIRELNIQVKPKEEQSPF